MQNDRWLLRFQIFLALCGRETFDARLPNENAVFKFLRRRVDGAKANHKGNLDGNGNEYNGCARAL